MRLRRDEDDEPLEIVLKFDEPPADRRARRADLTAGRQLVLVRHGRTEWNAEGRAQGQTDVDLDHVGVEQARAMAPVVAALEPVALWCSDLARAEDTAAFLAAYTGLPPRPDRRLREYGLGAREGIRRADWVKHHPVERAAFEEGDHDVVPSGERTADVASRTTAACRELLAEAGPGETVVAVSHGGAIRTVVAALLGWDAVTARTLGGLENCAWARLEERWYGADLRLVAWNARA